MFLPYIHGSCIAILDLITGAMLTATHHLYTCFGRPLWASPVATACLWEKRARQSRLYFFQALLCYRFGRQRVYTARCFLGVPNLLTAIASTDVLTQTNHSASPSTQSILSPLKGIQLSHISFPYVPIHPYPISVTPSSSPTPPTHNTITKFSPKPNSTTRDADRKSSRNAIKIDTY